MRLLRSLKPVYCLWLLTFSFLLPARADARMTETTSRQIALADFPTVDPNYIYNQLFYMATHFQHREAGYDKNLPVSVNGHDEFAAYWSEEMLHNLQGFGPQVRRDEFPVPGWLERPTTVPAFNVEVSVPGIIHPEHVVVIGCHYDGEAVSTQSAYDDASGCATELGIASALSSYWRSHHVYPARTLRFVIFDAEERGIYGSFHYVNSTINGDMHNLIAMFDEEGFGISYPLRYLGKLSNPLLPLYIYLSPQSNNYIYPAQDQLTQQQLDAITHFRAMLQEAIPAVFAQFRRMGFQELTYHANSGSDGPQPIFTSDQANSIQLGDDIYGSGDNFPFGLAGLPCASFAGNTTYYDSKPPVWSYPFDQKQDTIQLMNAFADGSSQQSQALTLALALPGMISTWMLNQPEILGQASANQNPIAAISDIGQTVAGKSISLDARASFDPRSGSNNALTYNWDFADGTTGSGVRVNHTYTADGLYLLTLTVSSPSGETYVSKLINVVKHAVTYPDFYTQFHPTGSPHHNSSIVLPTPDDQLTDRVIAVSVPVIQTAGRQKAPAPNKLTLGPITAISLLAIILMIGAVIATIRIRMRRGK